VIRLHLNETVAPPHGAHSASLNVFAAATNGGRLAWLLKCCGGRRCAGECPCYWRRPAPTTTTSTLLSTRRTLYSVSYSSCVRRQSSSLKLWENFEKTMCTVHFVEIADQSVNQSINTLLGPFYGAITVTSVTRCRCRCCCRCRGHRCAGGVRQ